MNQFMNQVALQTFSSFDTGNKPSEEQEPERFYHGFVLGLIVDLAEKYRITSNRESGQRPVFNCIIKGQTTDRIFFQLAE